MVRGWEESAAVKRWVALATLDGEKMGTDPTSSCIGGATVKRRWVVAADGEEDRSDYRVQTL